MIRAGQIALFRFPRTDLAQGKLRPALLLGRLPGEYDDWLICMISSQLRHHVPDFDEIIHGDDPDFSASGLRATSVIRVNRLAVVEAEILIDPHWEAITPAMREVLRFIGQRDSARRFYLAGGTALALRLGHRRSVDLDFFSETDFELMTIESMVLFENADRDLQPDLLIDTPWPEVRRFSIAQARALGERWFGQSGDRLE